MEVANIMPGDEVTVILTYTEILTRRGWRVRVRSIPAVVGPRYGGDAAAGCRRGADWISQPLRWRQGHGSNPASYEHQTSRSGSRARCRCGDLALAAAHELLTQWTSDKQVGETVAQGRRTTGAGNRDFILSYRLAGNAVESGLLIYKGGDENFFVAMVQPPARPTPAQIPPRDYLFVLDVSGSMFGFPLNTAKVLLTRFVQHLIRPTQQLQRNAVCRRIRPVGEALAAGHARQRRAGRWPSSIDSTVAAARNCCRLSSASAMPADPDRARSIVVVTDGYVDVETETFELIRENSIAPICSPSASAPRSTAC